MHKTYSILKNINSAKFFGCCSNSIEMPYNLSRVLINGFYNLNSENNTWQGNGNGYGYGTSSGNGNGYGEWGDDPVDFEKDFGDGKMTNYHICCFLGQRREWVAEQNLFFIEKFFDD